MASLADAPSRSNIFTRSLASIVVFAALAALNPAARGQAVQFQGSESTLASGMVFAVAVTTDASGNIYFADGQGAVVYKDTRNADGTYTQSVVTSCLSYCFGVAVDTGGNVYLTQQGLDEVLKETPSGGSYTQSVAVSGGLGQPISIAVDGNGNLYFIELDGQLIKESLSGASYTPSVIPTTGLLAPYSLTVDTNGNIYIVVDNAGNIGLVKETLSGGNYVPSTLGSGISFVSGVAVDSEGSVYLADSGNNRVLKEIPSGNGYAQSTLFSNISGPTNVALDSAGHIFVLNENDLFEINTAGIDLGSSPVGSSTAALSLQFLMNNGGTLGSLPSVVTEGASGSDFADAGTGTCTTNGAAYEYNAGDTCTINVTFTPSYPGQRSGAALIISNSSPIAGAFLHGTGTGPQIAFDPGVKSSSISAQYAAGVATDGQGDVYVVDSVSQTIVKYPPSGSPVPLASGVAASGIAIDGAGNVYYGSSQQNAIYMILANTTTSTQIATVYYPDNSLVVDGSGNLYVPTSENGTIVEIAQGTWAQSTVATLPGRVIGLAIDGAGNLYAADFNSNAIYEIAAGTFAVSQLTSGGYLNNPDGLAIDAAGNLYVSNFQGGVVRLAVGTYAQTLLASGYQALGLALDQSGNLYVGNGSDQNVEKFSRTSSSLTFPSTAVNASSESQSIEVSNIGNTTLTGTINSIAANFTQMEGSGTPADCTQSFSIASGEICNLSLNFNPQSVGVIDGSAILFSNSLNGTQFESKIGLSGSGQQATATITLANLSQIYTGSPLSATATTNPAGQNVTITYNGSTTAPTAVGSYTVVATITSGGDYIGTATGTLVISPAIATITLGNLSQTYTGSPLSAAATTNPAGQNFTITYNGSTTAPTAVGSYTVVATIASGGNYTGTATGKLVINPATATIALGNLSQSYTGSPLSATATTSPSGQTVNITYNGSATAPTAVGSYTVVATIASGGDYTGTATGTLVISPAIATITLGDLSQIYTGSALSATATTSPANLPVSVTYNGSATAPTAVGSYTVVATITSGGNYSGTATGTLVISKANQSITFSSIAEQIVGDTVNLSAASTSGLAVSFSSTTPAVCTVSGTTATMLSAGTCTIQASQAGNANYAAATSVSVGFAVNSASSFKLIAQPNSETIHRGDVAAFLLEAQSVNGFSGNVNITCSGGPVDSVCGDFPQTVKLLPNKLALAISGILFPSDTTPGTYILTFTGTSGSMTGTTIAQFVVEE